MQDGIEGWLRACALLELVDEEEATRLPIHGLARLWQTEERPKPVLDFGVGNRLWMTEDVWRWALGKTRLLILRSRATGTLTYRLEEAVRVVEWVQETYPQVKFEVEVAWHDGRRWIQDTEQTRWVTGLLSTKKDRR